MLDDSPEWLDTKYVRKILNNYTKNRLKEIISFTKTPATVKGENFASSMHLINVEYTRTTSDHSESSLQSVSLIVKSRLENEWMSAIEVDFNVFSRESQVYSVIMNELGALLHSIGDETQFGPRAIYVDDRVIVQENLKTKGYCIGDVKRGLNYEQCTLIAKKLAKFHAASMVLYKKNPDIFKYHLPGNMTEAENPMHELYKLFTRTTIEYCRTIPHLEKYVPKLEIFSKQIITKMINVFKRNENDRFHVLNHGDMWVNNIMFLRDSNAGEHFLDALFVDYQEGFYGSPGIDWNYFLFSSLQPTVFKTKDAIIEIYHRALADVLERLNYTESIPTVDDISKEILNKSDHGLATVLCLLPILINENHDIADPTIFLLDSEEAEENRRKIVFNPKYAALLETYLAFFEENIIL